MANKYWVGGGGDELWSNADNWSLTSGGAGGAGQPTGSTEDAIFDGNSPDCTSAYQTLKTLNCTAYTATLTMTHTLNIWGDALLSVAMTLNSTGGMTFWSTATIDTKGKDISNYSAVPTTYKNQTLASDLKCSGGMVHGYYARLYGQGYTVSVGVAFDYPNRYYHENGKVIILNNLQFQKWNIDNVGGTFYDLEILEGVTVIFRINQVYRVQGTFTSPGASGNPVVLRTTTGGTKSWLLLEGSGTDVITYTNPSDIWSVGGKRPISTNGVLSNSPFWRTVQPVTETITTAAELQALDAANTGLLANNIDLDGVTWTPIGTSDDPFTGEFNGQGNTLSNLTVDDSGNAFGLAGLFGIVGSRVYNNSHEQAVIHNFTLSTVSLIGEDYLGALIGDLRCAEVYDCTISGVTISSVGDPITMAGGLAGNIEGWANIQTHIHDCDIDGITITGNKELGGFVGKAVYGSAVTELLIEDCSIENVDITGIIDGSTTSSSIGGFVGNEKATIRNCAAGGKISGRGSVGGFMGIGTDSDIDKCSAEVQVSGITESGTVPTFIGGFLGQITGSTNNITDCFCTGNVITAPDGKYIGGFIGYTWSDDEIKNCYSAGTVSGDNYVGGFAGYVGGLTFRNVYSVGVVTANSNFGGFMGGNLGSMTLVNCSWYTGSSANAIGSPETATLAEGGNGTDEDNNSAFYSKTHAVYTGDDIWDFTTPIWYEYVLDYPKLTAVPETRKAINFYSRGSPEKPINFYDIIHLYGE